MHVKYQKMLFGGVSSVESNFAGDVLKGLSARQKNVPSSWLYDAKGSQFFEEICVQPEYYPTRCEMEILSKICPHLTEFLPPHFRLVELGAGDGSKAKLLLRQFLSERVVTDFCPIDICDESIGNLIVSLSAEFSVSDLKVQATTAGYWDGLGALKALNPDHVPQLVLFLGSSLGNHQHGEDEQFMRRLHASLQKNDQVLLGLDLVKEESILVPAYSDEAGITAEFNLNLLDRVNRELGGTFERSAFFHIAQYNYELSRMESHLVSMYKHTVNVSEVNKKLHFKKGESIHVECSIKYTEASIERIARNSGFRVRQYFYDQNHWFVDVLLQRI